MPKAIFINFKKCLKFPKPKKIVLLLILWVYKNVQISIFKIDVLIID